MDKRICVVSAAIPPKHSGAGLSAYKHSFRLHNKGQLGLVLTRTKKKLNKQQSIDLLGEYNGQFLSTIKFSTSCLCENNNLVSKITCYPFDFLFLWIRTGFVLWKNRNRYDIIHCFSPTWHSLFAILTGKILKKKIVLETTSVGGDDPLYVASYDKLKILYQRRNIQYRFADAIIGNSPALISRCKKKPQLKTKCHLVPRAYNETLFCQESNKQKIKKRLCVNEKHPIILFVGKITARKGVHIAIEALKYVKKVYPSAILIIVGPKDNTVLGLEYRKELDKTILRNALCKNVQFVGYVTNVNEYMKVADFLVLPSEREGLPNVVIEAMACGSIPIINNMYDISDFLINNGIDGFIIKKNKPADYAEVILDIVANPAKMNSVSEEAMKTAKNRFSTSVIDSKYNAVYNSLT